MKKIVIFFITALLIFDLTSCEIGGLKRPTGEWKCEDPKITIRESGSGTIELEDENIRKIHWDLGRGSIIRIQNHNEINGSKFYFFGSCKYRNGDLIFRVISSQVDFYPEGTEFVFKQVSQE